MYCYFYMYMKISSIEKKTWDIIITSYRFNPSLLKDSPKCELQPVVLEQLLV